MRSRRLRAKLRRLARDLRFEDAARLRDRVAALEEVAARVDELDRLRARELCILAPARERALLACVRRRAREGRGANRSAGRGGRLELEAWLAAASPGGAFAGARGRRGAPRRLGFRAQAAPELRIVTLALAEILAA